MMLACPLTKMHVAVTPMGFIQPCCRFKMAEHDEIFSNIEETTVLDGRKSDGFKAVERAFDAGVFPKGCSSCKIEEQNGIQSMRQKALLQNLPTEHLSYIEFFLGNTCNMKCRSCNPLYSSRWEGESHVIGFPLRNTLKVESAALLREMDVEHLERLKLLGGEPFYSKSFFEILYVLVETKRAPKLTLEISTNGSIFPQQSVIDQLLQFRKVQLSISIDDIGKRAEFLRSGTDWERVSQVLHQWFLFKETAKNFDIGVHITISAYNILHIDNILNYLSKMGWKDITVMAIKDPSELSPLRVPLSRRQVTWQKMNADLKTLISPLLHNRIEKILLTPAELPYEGFLHYNDKIDAFRGESVAQYFAETTPADLFWNDATCARP